MAARENNSLFDWPVDELGLRSPSIAGGRESKMRKLKSTSSRSRRRDSWFEDLSVINYDFLSRVLEAMRARETSSDVIESCLLHYAKKSFPGINRSSRKPANYSIASEAEQRSLLESIVANLPTENCSSSSRTSRFLFGLLRTANILKASEDCKCVLERKIGTQLERSTLDDLLIPSYSYLNDTLYDVDCIGRILGVFLESYDFSRESSGIMLVGKLMDGYLSEIASDSNLKLEQFCSLGLSLPDQARLFDDGLYRAVDLFFKAHPWTTESERERVCEVMDCQKLTLEACEHAAKNVGLPLRVVVQVLFFEQVQLRNAIASTYIGEEGGPIECLGRLSIRGHEEDERGGGISTQQPGTRRQRTGGREKQVLRLDMNSVKSRVHELERECLTMKRVIEKFDKGGASSSRKSSFVSKFGCKFKTQVCDSHEPTVMEGRRGKCVTGHGHYRN